MADKDIKVVIKAVLESKEFQDQLNKTKKSTENTSKGMLKSIGGIGTVFTGIIGGSVVAALKVFSSQGARFEQTLVSFKTLFKGNETASRSFVKQLQDLSAVTPFTQEQVLDAGKALKAFGIETENIIPNLKSIGDISAGTGKNFNELAVIYGKARAQGTLFAEDINQLTEAGIPIISELAKQFNVTEGEVKKLGSQGKIQFENLEQAFKSMTSEGGQFFNLTEAQSKTFSGRISTLVSNVQILATNIGLKLNGAASDYLDNLIKISKNQTVIEKTVQGVVLGVKLLELGINNLILPLKLLLQIGFIVFDELKKGADIVLKRFEFISEGVAFIGNSLAKVGELAGKAFGKFKAKIDDAKDSTDDNANAIERIKLLLLDTATNTAEKYADVAKAVADLFSKSNKEVENSSAQAVVVAELTAEEIAEIERKKRAKRKKQLLEDIKTSGTAFAQIGGAVAELGSAISDKLGNALTGFVNAGKTGFATVASIIKGDVLGAISGIISLIAQGIKALDNLITTEKEAAKIERELNKKKQDNARENERTLLDVQNSILDNTLNRIQQEINAEIDKYSQLSQAEKDYEEFKTKQAKKEFDKRLADAIEVGDTELAYELKLQGEAEKAREERERKRQEAEKRLAIETATIERQKADINKKLTLISLKQDMGEAIGNALSSMNFDAVPDIQATYMDLISQVEGLALPSIPSFAGGVTNFSGGLARINDAGGEVVRMPNGAQVMTNAASKDLLFGSGNRSSVTNVTNQTENITNNNFKIDGIRDINDFRNQLLRTEGKGAFR